MRTETYGSLEDFRRKQLEENTTHAGSTMNRVMKDIAPALDAWVAELSHELEHKGIELDPHEVTATTVTGHVIHPSRIEVAGSYRLGRQSGFGISIVVDPSLGGMLGIGAYSGRRELGARSIGSRRYGFDEHRPEAIVETLAGVSPASYAKLLTGNHPNPF